MKSILIFFLLACLSVGGSAQKISPTVLCNAGAVMKSGNFSLEWTLGEIATETLKSNNAILTQGFHQTNLTIVSTQNPYLAGLEIYPNPVTSKLIIQNGSGQKLQFNLSSISGQCISVFNFETGIHEVDMETLPSGSYILGASNNNTAQTYLIEKLK